MEKQTKLYKVGIGIMDGKAGEVQNWRNVNVLAKDAAEAIGKPKLSKREFVLEAEIIATVEVA